MTQKTILVYSSNYETVDSPEKLAADYNRNNPNSATLTVQNRSDFNQVLLERGLIKAVTIQ